MENGGAHELRTTQGSPATGSGAAGTTAGDGRLPFAAHGLVTRARIVLLGADGFSNQDIAVRMRRNPATVGRWRRRFVPYGRTGLHEELRPGRSRSIGDERVATLIRRTLRTKPQDGTHGSCRSPAAQTRLSKSTAQRSWRAFGLQPQRAQHCHLSNDPFFVGKVRAIAGLYPHPPDQALVLCVDEKSPIQALERTQPMPPLGLGYVEGVAHNYPRHGAATLFAARDPLPGAVMSPRQRRPRHQEFLRHLDANVPAALDAHLIVDNYATHKHPRVRRRPAARPRYHPHFTPTCSSWLNQVKIWFHVITRKAIRRGTFHSVRELATNIERFVHHYNANARPFSWTAAPDSILAKLQRLGERIPGTLH